MKKILFLNIITLFFLSVSAQTSAKKQVLKTIIQQRSISLNGGTRAAFGGKSRINIPIELPPNTKAWYYSFSTSPGQSGTKTLNLALQLSTLLANPMGITKAALGSITIPSGSHSLDIYLLDQNNVDLFMNKAAFHYLRQGSLENTKQAVVDIDEFRSGIYYLGLKNPSELEGINVTIEVVAVAQELREDESQAVTLGNLGWEAFQRGDYDRCMELSKKAIALDSTLPFVQFNVALTYLIKGQNAEATEAYSKAIFIAKKSENPRRSFQGPIQDLNTYMNTFPSKADAQDILDLLQKQLNRY